MVVMPTIDAGAPAIAAGMPSAGVPSQTSTPASKTGEADADRKKVTRSARFRAQLRKTELCRHKLNGKCRAGQACPFAHGEQELEARPDLSKTSLCKAWLDGHCPKEAEHCAYAHGAWELRTTEAFSKGGAKGQPLTKEAQRQASEGATPVHRGADESGLGPLPLRFRGQNHPQGMEVETMRAAGGPQGLPLSLTASVLGPYAGHGPSPMSDSPGGVRGARMKMGREPVSQRSTMPPESDQDNDIPQGVPSSPADTPAAGHRLFVLEMAAHLDEGLAVCTPCSPSSPIDYRMSAGLAGSPSWVQAPPLLFLPCLAPVPIVSSPCAQDFVAPQQDDHQKRLLREEIAALLRNAMPSHYED